MPIPSFGGLPPYPDFNDVTKKVNQLVSELRNLLLNLDSLNVVSLTADHVDTGTLDAGRVTVRVDYDSGAYIELGPNGITINNGTVDTFNADTNGAVTMTSATIQSATGYPKVEMNPADNLFAAYSDELNYLAIDPNYNNAPSIVIYAGGLPVGIIYESGGRVTFVTSSSRVLEIASGDDLELRSSNGDVRIIPSGYATLPNWSKLVNEATNKTLQQSLNDKLEGTGVSTIFETVDGKIITVIDGVVTNVS